MEKIRRYINNKTVIITAILLLIIIVVVTAIRLDNFAAYRIKVNLNEMSGCMHTDEYGGKYIVDYYDSSGDSEYALYGPYMTLRKGYYTVDINYDADYETRMDVHSNEFADYVESSGDIILKEQGTHKRFNIRIKDDVEDFEIRVKYNGLGELQVHGITITENTTGITTSAFLAFAAVVFLAGCYLFRQKIEQNKYTLAALAAITFLSCVPEMTLGMCMGHDGPFHLLRIEGLAEGLRSGTFPVRMQSNWMERYGYPVSIYYGDILLYIPALLRIIGFSVTQSYKAYLFLINLGTTVIAYGCFFKIVKNNRAALLGTAACVFATYRLTNVYVRLAVGEYSAIMFLPLVFLAVYRIYTEDTLGFKSDIKNALLLAAGMTGLVQTHLISVATVSLIIAVVCILMIRKTLRRKTLFVFVLAVAMTIAVNLFFLVPFLDYSKNVPVEVLNDSEEAVALIQGKGAYISQYFMLYQKAFGASGRNIGDRMAITPGIVLMTALFGGIYGCMKCRDKMIRFMTLMSVLLLWMSSNLFPWNFIISHVPLMGWISKIQFPWRFLPIAQVFLSLLLCMLLVKIEEEKRERTELALLALLIVATAQMFSGVIQERSYVEKYDIAGIDSFSLVNGEYVRAGTETDWFDGEVNTNQAWTIGDYTRDGKYAIIECMAADGADDAWVELPILHYKNYAAYGENGIPLNIVDGENNVIRVMLPSGYNGIVAVTYEIPTAYKAADICSLIALAVIAVMMLLLGKKQTVKRIEKQMNEKGGD